MDWSPQCPILQFTSQTCYPLVYPIVKFDVHKLSMLSAAAAVPWIDYMIFTMPHVRHNSACWTTRSRHRIISTSPHYMHVCSLQKSGIVIYEINPQPFTEVGHPCLRHLLQHHSFVHDRNWSRDNLGLELLSALHTAALATDKMALWRVKLMHNCFRLKTWVSIREKELLEFWDNDIKHYARKHLVRGFFE